MSRWRFARGEAGYTVAEVLVVAAVLALIMSGMLSLLVSGSQTWMAGSNRAEAQQSTRLVLSRMLGEIRTAGWDPKGAATFPAIQALTPPRVGFTISNDWSASGAIEIAAAVDIGGGVLRGEQIVYEFVAGELRRREVPLEASAVPVTGAIGSIQFQYLDADDTAVASPHLIANASSIRTVVITVTTTPDHAGAATSNVQVTSTSRARVRNRS